MEMYNMHDEEEDIYDDAPILDYLINKENVDNDINKNNVDKIKAFIWPDKAVLLLLELYREREEEFEHGFKRNNKIWAEIAGQIREIDKKYCVTGSQCSSKLAGLKRTYKNIVDSNKKSGNGNTSWTFYPVMDSIFGTKAATKPVAVASSEGPINLVEPTNDKDEFGSLASSSKTIKKKKKPLSNTLEHLVQIMEEEKKEKEREKLLKEKRHEERRQDREKKHKEQLQMQNSLISILQQFLNKQ